MEGEEMEEMEEGSNPFLQGRRSLLANATRLAALGLLPVAFAPAMWAQQSGGGSATAGPPQAAPVTPGSWLVLLGTRGGPGIDVARAQTASALVVDGTPYLIDCGYGTVRQLVAANVGYLGISQVFFTHLHDDHTSDLAALLSYQWTNSKSSPTDAYGPYGTEKLVEAAVAFFKANVEIRSVDEGRTLRPEAQYHGHDVAASPDPVQIYKDARVTVTAVANAHYPARSTARMPHRSIALRFDSRNRSVVFSGDTAYSESLVGLAHGADLFVCEIMDDTVHEQMLQRSRAATAAGNPDNIFRHVAETHSPPAQVARMASEAKVKTVVLNHQLPGPTQPGALAYPVTTFIEGVRKGFGGEVIVGQDLMVL
jgi:ribonuclease BN (tRNA processing enzyme)